MRHYVLSRCGDACHYCRRPLACTRCDPSVDSWTFGARRSLLTMDHVVPLALGGSRGIDNLVAACNWCNAAKRHDAVLVGTTECACRP